MAAITASNIFKASMGIDYLKRFMPDDLLNLLDDGQKAGANNAARTLLTTPSNYTPRGRSASDTGSGDGGEGRSLDGVGGLGSLSSLMDNPSRDNLQGLQNFAALNDTMLGRAMLDALGAMLDFAINPAPHAVGLAQGIAAGLESKMQGTSTIADSLGSFKSIPRMEALAANRAAISMNYDFNNMTPEEVANISLVSHFNAVANATGDVNPIDDPNVVAVGVIDGKIAGYQVKGPLGALMGYNSHTGKYEPHIGQFKETPKTELEKAKEKQKEVAKNARFSAALNNPVDPDTEAAIGGGRTGPEMSYGAAIINSALTYDPEDLPDEIDAAFSYNPSDLPDEIEAAKSFNPSAGVPNFGEDDDDDDEEDTVTSITGPETSASIGPGFSFSDDAGGDGGGSGGGTGGTSGTSGGFDVADAMGGNAGGIDGTSDSSGSDGISDDAGSGFKRGGFVHKRKTKKKKTRRGLASR